MNNGRRKSRRLTFARNGQAAVAFPPAEPAATSRGAAGVAPFARPSLLGANGAPREADRPLAACRLGKGRWADGTLSE